MNRKIKVQVLHNILFYASYVLILAFSFLGHIDGIGGYLNILSKLSLILLFLVFFLQLNKFTKKELLISLILLALSLINLHFTKDFTLVKLILIMLCLKNINFKKVIKFDIYSRLLLMLLIFFLVKIGICKDIVSYNDGFYKHSLGFNNPNVLGMHFFIVCIEYLYLNWKKMKFKNYLLIIIPTFILNNFIGCRTTIFIFLLLIVLKIIIDKYSFILNNKIISFIITHSYFIMFILTVVFYILYKNNLSIGIEINKLLSNRLFNIHYYLTRYNITILGTNRIGEYTLDSFYMHSLISYGILTFSLILFAMSNFFKRCFQCKKYDLVLIFFIFAIYGLSERLWFCVDYNIFISALCISYFTKYDNIIK